MHSYVLFRPMKKLHPLTFVTYPAKTHVNSGLHLYSTNLFKVSCEFWGRQLFWASKQASFSDSGRCMYGVCTDWKRSYVPKEYPFGMFEKLINLHRFVAVASALSQFSRLPALPYYIARINRDAMVLKEVFKEIQFSCGSLSPCRLNGSVVCALANPPRSSPPRRFGCDTYALLDGVGKQLVLS